MGASTQLSVHPASPVLLTKNGPLAALVECLGSIKHPRRLTYLSLRLHTVHYLATCHVTFRECAIYRQDDVEIVDADSSAAFAAYYAENGRQTDREVVYNPDLGLAMEALPAGMTLSDLWNVV